MFLTLIQIQVNIPRRWKARLAGNNNKVFADLAMSVLGTSNKLLLNYY